MLHLRSMRAGFSLIYRVLFLILFAAEQLPGFFVALLAGEVQGGEAAHVFEGRIGTGFYQDFDQLVAAEEGSKHEGRAAVAVGEVDVGAALDEQAA
jgi:hypothetical protein